MTVGYRLDFGHLQQLGVGPDFLNGARLRVLQNNTTNAIALYSDRACTISAANPVVASALGRFPVRYIASAQLMTWAMYDASDATYSDAIWSDNDIDAFVGASVLSPSTVEVHVATLAALKALDTSLYSGAVYVRGRLSAGDGYQGVFLFRSGDQSANVSADTTGAIWAAPNSGSSGSSGAWQRDWDGMRIDARWTGTVSGASSDQSSVLQAAYNLASANNCGLNIPLAAVRIDATFNMNADVDVYGLGAGILNNPSEAANTTISWYGAANGVAVIWGGNGSGVRATGGLHDIRIDGRAVADVALRMKDIQHGYSQHVLLTGAAVRALHITNSTSVDPTGNLTFDDLDVQLRGGSTDSANGIDIDGIGSGTDGVTKCTFTRTRVEHANGHGVIVRKRGDAFTWVDLATFRSDSETGIGVNIETGSTDRSIGGHVFVRPVLSSGMLVGVANQAAGWNIIDLDDTDLNSGVQDVVYGAGKSDVRVLSSYSGKLSGPQPDLRRARYADDMAFRAADLAVTNLLTTASRVWLTGITSAGAGEAIGDAGQADNGIVITSANTSGDQTYITDAVLGTSGYASTRNPALHFVATPLSTASHVMMCGFADGVGAPPTNGIWVESDPATETHYRFITRKAGTSTATVSTLSIAVAKIQWRIDFDATYARCYYRPVGSNNWTLVAVHTTNIPIVPIAALFLIRTSTAATKSMHLYHASLDSDIEV